MGLGEGMVTAGASMIGMKRGNAYANLGGQRLGLLESFHQGGFVGAYERFTNYFGGPNVKDMISGGSLSNKFLETVPGASNVLSQLRREQIPGSAGRAAMKELHGFAGGMRTTAMSRKLGYGIGGGIGLVAGGATIGYGNMLKGGAAWMGGSMVGRALGATATFGGNVAGGSRVGGRVGLGLFGGYKAAKWGGQKLGLW